MTLDIQALIQKMDEILSVIHRADVYENKYQY